MDITKMAPTELNKSVHVVVSTVNHGGCDHKYVSNLYTVGPNTRLFKSLI